MRNSPSIYRLINSTFGFFIYWDWCWFKSIVNWKKIITSIANNYEKNVQCVHVCTNSLSQFFACSFYDRIPKTWIWATRPTKISSSKRMQKQRRLIYIHCGPTFLIHSKFSMFNCNFWVVKNTLPDNKNYIPYFPNLLDYTV